MTIILPDGNEPAKAGFPNALSFTKSQNMICLLSTALENLDYKPGQVLPLSTSTLLLLTTGTLTCLKLGLCLVLCNTNTNGTRCSAADVFK